jgi:membrane-associated phospholipid phosphatase
MKGIKPADVLCGAFLVLLLLVVAAGWARLPRPGALALEYGLLLAAGAAIAAIGRSRPQGGWRLLHSFYPVVLIVAIFDSLAGVVGYVIGPDRDAALMAWDLSLFGVHPTLWLERIVTPWLTDLMHLAYVAYYVLPLVLCGRLYARGRQGDFDLAAFTLILTVFLSYLGYILVPAQGPRALLAPLQTVPLQGLIVTEPIRSTLEALEDLKRDAFPSGHTAVVVVLLALAWRYDRRVFWPALPVVLALIASTVYTRYHYAVDVLAGLLLAALCTLLGPPFYRRLARLAPGGGVDQRGRS